MTPKLSSNMSREYKEKICLCYSNDQRCALLTTKKDANTHSKDLDNYVRHPDHREAEGLSDLFGHPVRSSDAYRSFLEKHMRLMVWGDEVRGSGPELVWGRQAPPAVKEWCFRNTDEYLYVYMMVKDWERILARSTTNLELSALEYVLKTVEKRNKT